MISAASAFLALAFSFLQWRHSEKRSEVRDRRDHFLETVKAPLTKHIENLHELQLDIFRWASGDSETDFSILFERTAHYIQDLNRELNHLEGGDFGDMWDWLSINTDDILEVVDEVRWETRNLHLRTFSNNLRRLINELDSAIIASRPKAASSKKNSGRGR
nr:hypothetical protein [uncultured Celeribacter sp.]